MPAGTHTVRRQKRRAGWRGTCKGSTQLAVRNAEAKQFAHPTPPITPITSLLFRVCISALILSVWPHATPATPGSPRGELDKSRLRSRHFSTDSTADKLERTTRYKQRLKSRYQSFAFSNKSRCDRAPGARVLNLACSGFGNGNLPATGRTTSLGKPFSTTFVARFALTCRSHCPRVGLRRKPVLQGVRQPIARGVKTTWFDNHFSGDLSHSPQT